MQTHVVKRRRVLIIAAGICAAAVLVLAVWPEEKQPPEPEYGGKKLSEWLALYVDGPPQFSQPVPRNLPVQAVREIGTNGIPFLIRWIERDPSVSTIVTVGVANDLLNRFRRAKVSPTRAEVASNRARYAAAGFDILGTNASIAVPALAKRLLVDAGGAQWCARALASIGDAGLSPLLIGMTNGPWSTRPYVARSIGGMRLKGTNATAAASVLAPFVTNRDEKIAAESVMALGNLRAEPSVTVPLLIKGLKDQRGNVRNLSAFALGQYKGDARPAIQGLLLALRDADKNVRWNATNALSRIAPELGFKGDFPPAPQTGLPLPLGTGVTNRN